MALDDFEMCGFVIWFEWSLSSLTSEKIKKADERMERV